MSAHKSASVEAALHFPLSFFRISFITRSLPCKGLYDQNNASNKLRMMTTHSKIMRNLFGNNPFNFCTKMKERTNKTSDLAVKKGVIQHEPKKRALAQMVA